jgi:hypothetical protein
VENNRPVAPKTKMDWYKDKKKEKQWKKKGEGNLGQHDPKSGLDPRSRRG